MVLHGEYRPPMRRSRLSTARLRYWFEIRCPGSVIEFRKLIRLADQPAQKPQQSGPFLFVRRALDSNQRFFHLLEQLMKIGARFGFSRVHSGTLQRGDVCGNEVAA